MHLDRHKLNKCPVLLEQQQNAVVKKKVAVPGQAVLKCKVPTEAAKRYATERLANQELALSRYAALDTQVQQRSVHHQPTQRRPAQYLPSQNLPVPEQSAWPHLSPMSLMADYTRRQIYAQGAVMVPVSQPTTIDPRLIFRETTNDSFTPSQFSSHHAVPVQGAWTLPLDSDGTGNSSSVSTFGHHGPPNTGFWTRTPSLGDADNPISLGISPVAGSELSVDPPMPDLSSRTRKTVPGASTAYTIAQQPSGSRATSNAPSRDKSGLSDHDQAVVEQEQVHQSPSAEDFFHGNEPTDTMPEAHNGYGFWAYDTWNPRPQPQ
jgi:hypothetical protein